jgi:hypothetical protein
MAGIGPADREVNGKQIQTLLPAPTLVQPDYIVASDLMITLAARPLDMPATTLPVSCLNDHSSTSTSLRTRCRTFWKPAAKAGTTSSLDVELHVIFTGKHLETVTGFGSCRAHEPLDPLVA